MSREPAEKTPFRELMSDVEPLGGEPSLVLKRAREVTPGSRERRRAAEAAALIELNELSTSHIPPVDPHAELSFIRPGVQYGVFKRLRMGDYRFDARLDLHGHTVVQARDALCAFVRDCMKHDVRAALIAHGRGQERNPPALLKSCVASWLPKLSEVLAFHSAPRHLGGTGATAILLRKGERAKLENFEKHSKRGR
jgi:DNA-nicking Smr family endonuclease